MKQLCADMHDEYEELDALVSACSEHKWRQKTPFYDWSIYDEIAHLSYSDGNALLAMSDAVAFEIHAHKLVAWLEKEDVLMPFTYKDMGRPSVTALLSQWRHVRTQLLQCAAAHQSKDRFPWYGKSMSNKSLITARIMEVWAHGQDIYDTLRVPREHSDRIRHIAHLGVLTYEWSFVTNKQEPPKESPYVELIAPSGEMWCWGDKGSKERITGPALDFCLLVTRRRHMRDLALQGQGTAVSAWLKIAQCFAGPPEPGPGPGERDWT